MSNEQVKAIELKGIVHNATKMNTQDGQCEDIINLRCKDGSWRTSGDGRSVHSMTDGSVYSQLFVHTNIYRHLLGVKNGQLYWFANISTDGVTFTNLNTPILICSVTGDLFITQTGHLLTIIDGEKNYVYALFNAMNNTYKVLNVDENGSVYDRKLYPFGEVHFNLSMRNDYTCSGPNEDWKDANGTSFKNYVGYHNSSNEIFHSHVLESYEKSKEKNILTKPIMAFIAVKLYDGSYCFPSTPVLLYPYQAGMLLKYHKDDSGIKTLSGKYKAHIADGYKITSSGMSNSPLSVSHDDKNQNTQYLYGNRMDSLSSCWSQWYPSYDIETSGEIHSSISSRPYKSQGNTVIDGKWDLVRVYGYDILLSIEDISLMINNSELFSGIGVFVTKEVDVYKLAADDYKYGSKINARLYYDENFNKLGINSEGGVASDTKKYYTLYTHGYSPAPRTSSDILYDLMHSPFYLLREYSVSELSNLQTSLRVDLSAPEYKGVLSNIEQQPTFNGDFNGRATYVPKVAYSYNQRLHIANYTKTLFHGYPIEQFMFNNHDGVVDNAYSDLGLKNFRANDHYSFHEDGHVVGEVNGSYHQGKIISATINTYIKTDNGDTIVSRVLSNPPSSTRQFLEALPPLIFYPDSRAYKMAIHICLYNPKTGKYAHVSGAVHSDNGRIKQHPLYNLSYGLLKSGLEPFELWKLGGGNGDATAFNFTETSASTDIDGLPIGQEQNATEEMPNAIKVSSTSNPFIFPAKNTYQVGSSEIMALCSNAVAIGTGQTGAAPLYVFCKDGVYALLVDSSGEMVYTNSRIIARDVINQYNRATPIDDGVVFTTDRGLMSVSGSEVVELGQPLEGDYEHFNNASYPEYNKIAANAYTMTKLGGLPSGSITKTDFLTYLKNAIVNYNHNERELMVSNSRYSYSYILDRYGNWSRRAFTADEYVNNYPTSYRKKGNTLYKVDADSDADNAMFVMSKVLKLDSIGFKELHRVVARGWFKTQESLVVSTGINEQFSNEYTLEQVDTLFSATSLNGVSNNKLNLTIYSSGYIKRECVGNKYRIVIDNTNDSDHEICAYLKIKEPGYGFIYPGHISNPKEVYLEKYSDICFPASTETMEFEITQDMVNKPVEILLYICRGKGSTETIDYVDASICTYDVSNRLGLYVFGSYDGRKWACLGHREKNGTFTDIGTLVEHTDCRYFRFVLAGKLTKESRFDYIEVSAKESKLSTKIR